MEIQVGQNTTLCRFICYDKKHSLHLRLSELIKTLIIKSETTAESQHLNYVFFIA